MLNLLFVAEKYQIKQDRGKIENHVWLKMIAIK